MTFDKILVPTDGSEFTKAAAGKAMDLAELTDGTVTVLYVIDQTLFMNVPVDSAIASVYAALKKEGQDAVNVIKTMCEARNINVRTEVTDGHPVKVILETAKNHDIIVMGTLGRTGVSKLLMGSVAERVVRQSTGPVMVVRSPEVDRK